MEIKRFEGGELLSNGYVLWNKGEDSCWLIDTGYNADKFIAFVKENNFKANGIIFTHHHYDHITDGPAISRKLDCDMYINEDDFARAKKTLGDGGASLISFTEDKEFILGDDKLVCLKTPGHTKGGVCLISEKSKVAFTGDTLFATEIGITNLDDGSPEEMAESCRYINENWPDDMMIYPGHGPSATIKEVKESNTEFNDALEYGKK